MEFVCQFFEDKKQIVRLYIATKDDIYKTEAERFYKCPILFLNNFVESSNVFIWNGIQVMVFSEFLYIFDESGNYISIMIGSWLAKNVYVSNIDEFNKTWKCICCIFAELCVGDIVIDFGLASKFVKVGDIFLPMRDKFGIYKSGRITRLSLD